MCDANTSVPFPCHDATVLTPLKAHEDFPSGCAFSFFFFLFLNQLLLTAVHSRAPQVSNFSEHSRCISTFLACVDKEDRKEYSPWASSSRRHKGGVDRRSRRWSSNCSSSSSSSSSSSWNANDESRHREQRRANRSLASGDGIRTKSRRLSLIPTTSPRNE